MDVVAVIETARLRLVPVRVEHADEMAGVLADARLHTYIGGAPEDVTALRARYRRWAAGSPDQAVTWGNWVIEVRGDGGLVGTVQATITGSSMASSARASTRAGAGSSTEAVTASITGASTGAIAELGTEARTGSSAGASTRSTTGMHTATSTPARTGASTAAIAGLGTGARAGSSTRVSTGVSAEIAWVVGTRWQGRGIATEAARGLLGWLRSRGVLTVFAHIHPGNAASAAVAHAVGLRAIDEGQDGEVRWRLVVEGDHE